MRTLFDGGFSVDYGQGYVMCFDADWDGDMNAAFYGQANGLCGAGVPGALWLITGTNYGTVSMRVEAYDEAPPVDDGWEEIVEVPFHLTAAEVSLLEWGGSAAYPLDLPAPDYRVRYSASGMDPAREHNNAVDRYLLQFWPAPPDRDQVIKQTSAAAAYWHRNAVEIAPPKTPEEKEEERRRHEEHRRQHSEQTQLSAQLHRWKGLPAPSEALLRAGGYAADLARLDRQLVDAIASADPGVLAAIPHWLATKDLPPGPHVIAMFVGQDPLRGALDAIYQAARKPGTDQRALFADIRERFRC
jgi:hypothetical protein